MKKYFKAESRVDWFRDVSAEATLPIDDIRTGALLRIADAVELMAKNYAQLQRDRDYFEKRSKEEYAAARRLAHSNAALRGHLKRAKARGK